MSPELASIVKLANEVWGDPKRADYFLRTAHSRLNGKTPMRVARTEDGARRVREILNAINQPVVA